MVLHGNPDVLSTHEGDHPRTVVFAKGRTHPARSMGAVLFRFAHINGGRVVSPSGTGLNLTRVPARSLFRRTLKDVTNQGVLTLGRGLVPADKAVGLVTDPTENVVDDFGVTTVVANEDDFVETMVDHAHRQVVNDCPVGVARQGHGSGPLFHFTHVVRGVSNRNQRCIAGLGDRCRRFNHTHGGKAVGPERTVGTVFFGRTHWDHDYVVGLEVFAYFVITFFSDVP